MKIRLVAFLILLIFGRIPSYAASYVFDYNSRCQAAYQQYMSLHFDEGREIIRQELIANPYNLMATYLADYEDCLLMLFNGDHRDYEQRESHFQERLQLLSKGDERSPWFGFCKSGLYFHWAMVHIRFGENLKAASRFRKSFLLVRENNRKFPDFPQNKVFLGVEEAVVGTIPDDYKWLAAIFGMKGNVRHGIGQLAAFIKNSDDHTPMHNEAVIYYCYLRFYLLSQQDEVWNYVNSSQFPLQNNLFHVFVKSNLALNNRKAEVAIQLLKDAQQSEDYKQFPVFDYELGTALLFKLDNSNAVFYLNRFLASYKGGFFVKDTWQKLSWAYYLRQDARQAAYSRRQIGKTGSVNTDADKQAQRFSESAGWPALPILQARLLIDGGYYQQALQKLHSVNPGSLASATDRLEYYFRLGRAYDELKIDTKAIEYYRTTADLGKGRKEHFAARSALQMGMIYERSGKIPEAIEKYNECLSMKNHDFQSNIDQQAKAGINRLTKQ